MQQALISLVFPWLWTPFLLAFHEPDLHTAKSPTCVVAYLLPAPTLQGPKVRLQRPSFTPLAPSELPQPGSLFALDAEFVAFLPPEKALQRCRFSGLVLAPCR